MPSDSKTTDPRPAATEAAHTAMKLAISRASSCYNFIPNPDAMLIALEREGYIIAPIAAAPPSGRAACPTCGETGVDHDGFACRDCNGQGSTPIAAPPSGQVVVTRNDLEWAVKTLEQHGYTDGKLMKRLNAALADAE